jgi:RNA polymerase sigma-70 factor (ECF subfamily)
MARQGLLTNKGDERFLAEEHMSITALAPVKGLALSVVEGLPSAHGVTLTSELEDLFRQHHRLIYRTAYSVIGSKPDAEDVLQVIFLRLLRRGLPPDLEQNPAGYLYRAAVNLSLDAVRSRSRRKTTNGVERVLVPVQPTVEEGPEDDARRRLREAVAQLKPRAVEILVLRYVHDRTDAEIAKMLGTSRGVIAVTLFRARARLKKLLSHVTSTSAEASVDKSGGRREA